MSFRTNYRAFGGSVSDLYCFKEIEYQNIILICAHMAQFSYFSTSSKMCLMGDIKVRVYFSSSDSAQLSMCIFRILVNESGYFKSRSSADFWRKFRCFPKKWIYECPLFLGKTWDLWGHFEKIIFPLAVPLINISPPKYRDFGYIFVISNDGAILRKRSDARGKVLKMSGMNTLILL